jgi:D-alanine transaminase
MEGTLRTHPLSNRILGGITRLHAIEIAGRMGIPVEEMAFSLAEITQAGPPDLEVFSASTTKDLMPVVRIGDAVVRDGRPGPVTLELLDAFRREQALLVGVEPPLSLRQALFS